MNDRYRDKPKELPEWLKKISEMPACKECGVIAGRCLLEVMGMKCKKETRDE